MHRLLDVLASGVHDTKNQLFLAESLISSAEARYGIDLGEARYAVESAAERLARALSSYHLLRRGASLAIVPTVVEDLCQEVALALERHLAQAGVGLEVLCTVRDAWPVDRDLLTDILNNAVQNAGRHARSRVRLQACREGGDLRFRVEDDGPGFASLDHKVLYASGTGLIVAERLARLHEGQGRHGTLNLSNGGELGGAVFELRLP